MKPTICIFSSLMLILCLASCRTLQQAQTTNNVQSHTHRDSIYLHDSIRVEYRRGNFSPMLGEMPEGQRSTDTLYIERYRTRYQDRIIHHTDTITQTLTQTIEKPYIPRFYRLSTLILYILIALFVLLALLKLKHIL